MDAFDKATAQIMGYEDLVILLLMHSNGGKESVRKFFGNYIRSRPEDMSLLERVKLLKMAVDDNFPQYKEILDELLVLI
jgi:hypothetical protein